MENNKGKFETTITSIDKVPCMFLILFVIFTLLKIISKVRENAVADGIFDTPSLE